MNGFLVVPVEVPSEYSSFLPDDLRSLLEAYDFKMPEAPWLLTLPETCAAIRALVAETPDIETVEETFTEVGGWVKKTAQEEEEASEQDK